MAGQAVFVQPIRGKPPAAQMNGPRVGLGIHHHHADQRGGGVRRGELPRGKVGVGHGIGQAVVPALQNQRLHLFADGNLAADVLLFRLGQQL